jgi:hypothetical protein
VQRTSQKSSPDIKVNTVRDKFAILYILKGMKCVVTAVLSGKKSSLNAWHWMGKPIPTCRNCPREMVSAPLIEEFVGQSTQNQGIFYRSKNCGIVLKGFEF